MADAAPRASTRLAAVAARVALVNGAYVPFGKSMVVIERINEASAEYAEKIAALIESVDYDTGRLIAALDHVQLVKTIACDAVILPHTPKQ